VFWTWVLGPLGALLAIPPSLLTKGLLVDIDPTTRWINPLISAQDTDDDSDRHSGRRARRAAAAPR
jgi:AI-2 transport protein TqsA